MRRPKTALVIAAAAAASWSMAAADVPVFSRQVLADVSWLEVEVRDARRVTATHRGEEQTFAYGLGLSFVEKGRTESESRSERGRSLVLAGNFSEGAAAWDAFRARLLEFAKRTEPAQLEQLLTRGELVDTTVPGTYLAVACAAGAADGGEVVYEITRAERGGGFTTFPRAGALCAALADAVRFAEPSAVLFARMSVAAADEQVIEWTETDRTSRPPRPLPDGISVEREPPPPNAAAWSHEEPGKYGLLITDDEGRPSHVLRTAVTAKAVDPAVLEGRSLLARLSARTVSRTFGRAPASTTRDAFTLDLAFIIADGSRANSDALLAALAAAAARGEGLLGPADVRATVVNSALALGPERAYLVLCTRNARDATNELAAEICANRACAALDDPRRFCGELEAALR